MSKDERKRQATFQRELRARGVYKPYVSFEQLRTVIESYPIACYITIHHDDEYGPYHYLKLTDHSLARIGQDATITTHRVWMGQDLIQHVAQLILDFHQKAYNRAIAQDNAALALGRRTA